VSSQVKQNPLSFIAPIKEGKYEALRGLIAELDEKGLNSVGTVHFGNFIFLEPAIKDGKEYHKKFALFTFYDGEFDKYVQDFVNHVGKVFDALLSCLDDVPDNLIPVNKNPKKFAEYVKKYDQPVAKWYTAYPDKLVKQITTDPVEGVVIIPPQKV